MLELLGVPVLELLSLDLLLEYFFMGGALFLEPIFSPFRRQCQVVPVSKLIDIVVLFIFASIIGIVILSTVCTWASSYFITSTLMGTFGPYVSYFIGNVIALHETITGNANIASSGFNGGLIGGIIAGIYRTKAANDLRDNEFEVYALGAIGAITGCITARLDEAIGNALLTKFDVGIPLGGVALGAFSALIGGAFLVTAKIPMGIVNKTAVTKVGGLVVTVTLMTGGFIGGIIGGYFSCSAVFTGLLGITFSVTSMVILTAVSLIL